MPFTIFRGLHPVLDNEALRYVRQLPRFKPGAFDEKPWSVKFTLPLLIHPYYLRLLEREEQQPTDATVYKVVEKKTVGNSFFHTFFLFSL